MPSITQVPDKAAHDGIIAEAIDHPTVLYLSSSVLPACKSFTPEYERLATTEKDIRDDIRFCQMEYSSETSPLFKFSQAQLPVVIFMYADRWVKTLLSPTVKEVEAGLAELSEKTRALNR